MKNIFGTFVTLSSYVIDKKVCTSRGIILYMFGSKSLDFNVS